MADYFLTTGNVATAWQRFAVRTLAAFGWRVNFKPLPGPHGVLIVYPHTSNWDFIVGMLAKWAIGVHVHWLGKEALFRGICGMTLGPLFRAWGGEPVERASSTGAIERLAHRIGAADEYWLALAPEGTRKYRDCWRSGFYHIALTAGVPLGLAGLDYARKQVRLIDYIELTGNRERDLAAIREVYADCKGMKPEFASPIDFNASAANTAPGNDRSA
ncbi:MAG TPA: 1-acyl-sn-glycerol-3-phosphate acyltransferase [Paucimonas sp.]|nr:1-acyl-sn-glycerol-3-phosphate acyltransferase [Paucimonas sp.]